MNKAMIFFYKIMNKRLKEEIKKYKEIIKEYKNFLNYEYNWFDTHKSEYSLILKYNIEKNNKKIKQLEEKREKRK